MQSKVVQAINPFLSFMHFFQKAKTHNMLCIMLDPCYKGLGLVIHFVGKEKTLQIIGAYDNEVFFPLLISTYGFLNPSDLVFELLALHPKTLKSEILMNTWRLMRRWHPQWWKNNLIISGEKGHI
jgi:hypothetical protein